MARIVAAFGTSHSTMLMSALEHWLVMFDHVDRRAPIYDFAGRRRSFDELLACLPPEAAARVAPAAMIRRFEQAQSAMTRLAGDIADARLDALIVVGDDQREVFQDSLRPAIGIYYGATVRNAAAPTPPPDDWYTRDQHKRMEDGRDVHYPVHAGLAAHLIEELSSRHFDITAIQALPAERFEGHAFSFVHRRYLAGHHLPIVPVFLNTYYPPNQPSPARCLELGRALHEAVLRFSDDLRVGVMASGGLSHFLVNEALDHQVIDALRRKDPAQLAGLDPSLLQSGSSEIRNWICVAAAARDLDLDWISYVPGYRSRALTGVGLCFARWAPVSAAP